MSQQQETTDIQLTDIYQDEKTKGYKVSFFTIGQIFLIYILLQAVYYTLYSQNMQDIFSRV